MAISQKELVLQHLYRVRPAGGVVDWDTFAVGVFQDALKLTRLAAERFAHRNNLNRFWDYLLEQLEQDRFAGRSPVFEVQDEHSKKLLWFHDTIAASRPGRAYRVRRRAEVLAAIDALSARQYEALGGYACQALGADKIRVTRGSGDGGVDFLACIAVRRDSHIFSGSGGRLRIIGQSKNYHKPLEGITVKEFITTINEIKGHTPPVTEHVPDWFYSSPGPIVGWIACHAGFQSGAVDRARNNGILLTDSIDYAELLAHCRPLRDCDPFVFLKDRLQEVFDKHGPPPAPDG